MGLPDGQLRSVALLARFQGISCEFWKDWKHQRMSAVGVDT